MTEVQTRKKICSKENIIKDNEIKNQEKNKSNDKTIQNKCLMTNENQNEIDDFINNLRMKKDLEKKAAMQNDFTKKNKYKELEQQSKILLKESSHKTHFKAVSMIANYYNDTSKKFLL